MFVINKNDEYIEVDDEGVPLCPDCGANENTFNLTDALGEPIYKGNWPKCATCGVQHPKEYCEACHVRPKLGAGKKDREPSCLCFDCTRKARELIGSGFSIQQISGNNLGLATHIENGILERAHPTLPLFREVTVVPLSEIRERAELTRLLAKYGVPT